MKKIIISILITITLNANLIESKKYDSQQLKTRISIINKKIENLKKINQLEQLKEVNRIFNYAIKYATDIEIYNKKNYIASLRETIKMDLKGDCDDYAMAKLEALLYLGFKSENIKLLHTNENNTRHVKLLVLLDKKIYVLDSFDKKFRLYNYKDEKHKTPSLYSSNVYIKIFKSKYI